MGAIPLPVPSGGAADPPTILNSSLMSTISSARQGVRTTNDRHRVKNLFAKEQTWTNNHFNQ